MGGLKLESNPGVARALEDFRAKYGRDPNTPDERTGIMLAGAYASNPDETNKLRAKQGLEPLAVGEDGLTVKPPASETSTTPKQSTLINTPDVRTPSSSVGSKETSNIAATKPSARGSSTPSILALQRRAVQAKSLLGL